MEAQWSEAASACHTHTHTRAKYRLQFNYNYQSGCADTQFKPVLFSPPCIQTFQPQAIRNQEVFLLSFFICTINIMTEEPPPPPPCWGFTSLEYFF